MNKVLIAIILICSCKPHCTELGGHNWLMLENNSSRTVEFTIVDNYPDTIIPPDLYNLNTDQEGPLLPHTKRESKVSRPGAGCIEDDYSRGEVNWLYFFDSDSLNLLSWDTVRLTGRGILQRTPIDLEYLKAHNFTLTYEE